MEVKIVSTKEEAYSIASVSLRGLLFKLIAALLLLIIILGGLIFAAYITASISIFISLAFILLFLLLVGWLLIPRCKNFSKSAVYNETAVNKLESYKNEELLTQAWNKVKHWDENTHIIHQPRPGYCSLASANSVIQSICAYPIVAPIHNTNITNNFNFFIQFPAKARPMTLTTLTKKWYETLIPYILENGENKDSNSSFVSDIQVTSIDFTQVTIEQCTKVIRECIDTSINDR